MATTAVKDANGAAGYREDPLNPIKLYFREIGKLGEPPTKTEQRELAGRVSRQMRKCIEAVFRRYREAEKTCRERERKKRPPRDQRQARTYAAARKTVERWNPNGALAGAKLKEALRKAVYDQPVRCLAEFVSEEAAGDFRKLTERNLRLVISCARAYNGRSNLTLNELIQEGNIGLMMGIARFDDRRGYQLSTYVNWWIRHALGRSIADKSNIVRMPVHHADLINRIRRCSRQLQKMLERTPTHEDIAEAMAHEHLTKTLGRSPAPEEVAEARGDWLKKIIKADGLTVRFIFSLNKEIGPADDREFLETIENDPERVVDPDEGIYKEQRLVELRRAMMRLDPRVRRIIELRFGLTDEDETLTLNEIGQQFGLSRERIRQLENETLKKLKKLLAPGSVNAP